MDEYKFFFDNNDEQKNNKIFNNKWKCKKSLYSTILLIKIEILKCFADKKNIIDKKNQ